MQCTNRCYHAMERSVERVTGRTETANIQALGKAILGFSYCASISIDILNIEFSGHTCCALQVHRKLNCRDGTHIINQV
jgi:hypothetical protein